MTEPQREFDQAARGANIGFFAEFIEFLKNNKKWWLLPILVVILLVGLLIMLNATGAAPFVYSFF
ncbi:MAG: DUF5989 family protein [Planctomycetota bacterium]|nr:DUF5989 family protein [Planctomycetota bacterium]